MPKSVSQNGNPRPYLEPMLRIVTRLSAKDVERLDRMAKAEHRDRSAQVTIGIQEMLRKWEAKK